MRLILITLGLVYVAIIVVVTLIVLTKQPTMPPSPSYLPEVNQR